MPPNLRQRAAKLWYKHPARTWNEALPIGNSRLGAMVYSRLTTELLQLNEDSVYYGSAQDHTSRSALEKLPELPRLIREKEHEAAEDLVNLAPLSSPSCQRHYEPLATVKVEFGHEEKTVSNYRRALDLQSAVATTEYGHDGIRWKREMIASYSDDILALRIQADRRSIFTIQLSRHGEQEWDTNEFYDSLENVYGKVVMRFQPGGQDSVRACCVMTPSCEDSGTIAHFGYCLRIDASEAYLLIAAHTS